LQKAGGRPRHTEYPDLGHNAADHVAGNHAFAGGAILAHANGTAHLGERISTTRRRSRTSAISPSSCGRATSPPIRFWRRAGRHGGHRATVLRPAAVTPRARATVPRSDR
jgi:hypothetical protein